MGRSFRLFSSSLRTFSFYNAHKFGFLSTIPGSSNSDYKYKTYRSRYRKICAISLVGSTYIAYSLLNQPAKAEAEKESSKNEIFKLSEVAEHNSIDNGVWVTYQGSVYDITKFVNLHPGGKKILMAAGGGLEPFWVLYGFHDKPEVKELLDEYKIGILSPEDVNESKNFDIDDPFANDPRRHPALKAASKKPFNAEPPPPLLVDSFNTPKNHMPVPDVDLSMYKLEVIYGKQKVALSLQEIKKLPKVTINATIQCAGNRRSEMSKIKPVKGLSWGHAALGNADWTGVRLVDVLHHYGFTPSTNVQHVHFEGLDAGGDGVSYAASIPAKRALDPHNDVILAYEMNGQPLSRDHGAPLRVVVPGVVGARNVKWVGRIVLSDHESKSHWQQNDYKGLSPSVDWDTADFSKAPAIQELPVISAICIPEDGETIEVNEGTIPVRGYAWSGDGKKIVRVDVSTDLGKTWLTADLQQGGDDAPQHWSWTLWSINMPVDTTINSQIEIWAKAVDSSYNTQPESFEHIWNFRGVLGNAYHKIRVTLSS